MQRKSGTQESRKRSEFDQTIPGLLDSKFVSYHCETSLGVDKFGNEGAGRLFTKIGERTLLDDSAFIHEHDFVSEIAASARSCVTRSAVCRRRAKISFKSFCNAARTSGSSAPSGSSSSNSSGESINARIKLTR